jgi:DNA-binding beta-propeller fold protein YncE
VSRSAACLMSFVIASIVCVAVQAAEAEALPRLPLAYLEVDLDANDIVFDPVSGTLFASVGSAGGTYANSVVPIDPATGKLGEAIPVGLEPNKLALSGNGQYLYVGVDGESSVARVNIPLRIVDLRWHLGSGNPACGPWSAADMVVLGGLPMSVAVSRRNGGCSLGEGIVIYDEAIPRPIATDRPGPTFIEGSADDASRLYGLDSPGSPRHASVMAIDSNGITELQLSSPNLQVPNGDFVYDGGMLFDGVHVLDAASLTPLHRAPRG